MKVIKHRFTNYKGTPDIEVDYKGAGLYLVYGPNEAGKTSFLENSKTLMVGKESAPVPVKLGKGSSINIGNYIDAKGNVAEVTKSIDATTNKVKFELIYNDLKTNKVGDVKDLFKFNDASAEEFISWGKTKDGRRKQLDYVLQILTDKDRKEFVDLQAKEASYFTDRSAVNKSVKKLEVSVENNALTEEEIKKIELKEKAETFIEAANKKIANVDTDIEKVKNLKSNKTNFNSIIESVNIDDFDAEIVNQFNTVIERINKAFDDDIESIKSIDVSELRLKVDKYKIGLKAISELENKQSVYKSDLDKLEQELADQEELNNNITLVREKIENFFSDKNLPIKELVIGSLDEGLSVMTPEGILPFDEKQLSTSQIMMITLKIMYFVNKNVDIIYLGKLESFGNKKLKALIDFAKEYDVQIIADKVNEDDNAPFVVEILWDINDREELVSIPLDKEDDEPKAIPTKIEKRKTEGRVNASKKEIKVKEVLSEENKTKIENDLLDQTDIF